MRYVIYDIFDDFRNIELTDKAKSVLWTIGLVVAGLYWICLSDFGAFFQLTGFAMYMYFSANCITKTFWGKRFMRELRSYSDDEE